MRRTKLLQERIRFTFQSWMLIVVCMVGVAALIVVGSGMAATWDSDYRAAFQHGEFAMSNTVLIDYGETVSPPYTPELYDKMKGYDEGTIITDVVQTYLFKGGCRVMTLPKKATGVRAASATELPRGEVTVSMPADPSGAVNVCVRQPDLSARLYLWAEVPADK